MALTAFAELRCRQDRRTKSGQHREWPCDASFHAPVQGAISSWPLLMKHRSELPLSCLAEGVWAASGIPSPPREVVYEAVGLAREVGPHMKKLPDEALYRCIYGLARIHTGRGSTELLRRAEASVTQSLGKKPCPFAPRQLVRLCWAMARLGCRDNRIFEGIENRIADVLNRLEVKELEALYGILTELKRVRQWKLIHDVERALESREDEAASSNKSARRKPFRRRWTRADLMHSVLQRK